MVIMSNFCLLAYIPCIILIIWLLIELRKFVILNRRYTRTSAAWKNIQYKRSKRSRKRSKDRYIETIPPPPPDYYEDWSKKDRGKQDFIDYEVDTSYSDARFYRDGTHSKRRTVQDRRASRGNGYPNEYDEYDEYDEYKKSTERGRGPKYREGLGSSRGRTSKPRRGPKPRRHRPEARPKSRARKEYLSSNEKEEYIEDDDAEVDWD